ncbi:MAG: hypothetical protein M3M85_02870 [bacterium]|nr:hypothetical protein [bacterium]
MKIIFGVFILPALLVHEGYERLNKYLKKRGWPQIDWFDMTLLGLLIILVLLLLNGYRW